MCTVLACISPTMPKKKKKSSKIKQKPIDLSNHKKVDKNSRWKIYSKFLELKEVNISFWTLKKMCCLT